MPREPTVIRMNLLCVKGGWRELSSVYDVDKPLATAVGIQTGSQACIRTSSRARAVCAQKDNIESWVGLCVGVGHTMLNWTFVWPGDIVTFVQCDQPQIIASALFVTLFCLRPQCKQTCLHAEGANFFISFVAKKLRFLPVDTQHKMPKL